MPTSSYSLLFGRRPDAGYSVCWLIWFQIFDAKYINTKSCPVNCPELPFPLSFIKAMCRTIIAAIIEFREREKHPTSVPGTPLSPDSLKFQLLDIPLPTPPVCTSPVSNMDVGSSQDRPSTVNTNTRLLFFRRSRWCSVCASISSCLFGRTAYENTHLHEMLRRCFSSLSTIYELAKLWAIFSGWFNNVSRTLSWHLRPDFVQKCSSYFAEVAVTIAHKDSLVVRIAGWDSSVGFINVHKSLPNTVSGFNGTSWEYRCYESFTSCSLWCRACW